MKTARFLADQLRRLHEAGIETFVIRGNHDAESRITRELTLPESVKVFGGRAEAVTLSRGGLDVAVHGVSFAHKHAPESLLPKFRRRSLAPSISACCTRASAARRRTAFTRRAPRRSARRRLRLLGARPHPSAVRGAGQGGDRDAGQSARARHQRGGAEVGDAGRRSATTVRIKIEERSTSVAQFERLRSILPASRIGGRRWRGSRRGFSPRAPPRRASIWSRGSRSPARRRSPGGCAGRRRAGGGIARGRRDRQDLDRQDRTRLRRAASERSCRVERSGR